MQAYKTMTSSGMQIALTVRSLLIPTPDLLLTSSFANAVAYVGVVHYSCVIQTVHTEVYSVQHVDYLNVRSLATVSPHNL